MDFGIWRSEEQGPSSTNAGRSKPPEDRGTAEPGVPGGCPALGREKTPPRPSLAYGGPHASPPGEDDAEFPFWGPGKLGFDWQKRGCSGLEGGAKRASGARSRLLFCPHGFEHGMVQGLAFGLSKKPDGACFGWLPPHVPEVPQGRLRSPLGLPLVLLWETLNDPDRWAFGILERETVETRGTCRVFRHQFTLSKLKGPHWPFLKGALMSKKPSRGDYEELLPSSHLSWG
ncbi:hypothetical protein GWK47_054100 [Chionoecetes opilio]|uniref:Uncharacterized protein n=1 Tax=Chionoecetes opilio TaxID=41210 RepID=A0A8J4Y7A9_CHIOP|nr:hypothetical protein GWK47_054100 [Chionoecetes opilio]